MKYKLIMGENTWIPNTSICLLKDVNVNENMQNTGDLFNKLLDELLLLSQDTN